MARTSGQVLSGTVTSVLGGVTMLWDMYQLKDGLAQLADGSEEGVEQIREIATQLELALSHFTHQHTAGTAARAWWRCRGTCSRL